MTSFQTIYLLRKGNPDFWAKRFLRSFFRHTPAPGARLTLLLKGFESGETPAALSRLSQAHLKDMTFEHVDDEGFDLFAYHSYCKRAPDTLCLFLNSHSEILHSNYIDCFEKALLQTNGRGIVGASGSYESPDQQTLPFPNAHIRTTGFLVNTDLYAKCVQHDLTTKAGCHAFEAGQNSLTRQIADKGFPTLVVNSDGKLFDPESWDQSQTFRLGDQQKLLIGDNRSRKFHNGTNARRKHHATSSWGEDVLVGKSSLLRVAKRQISEKLERVR